MTARGLRNNNPGNIRINGDLFQGEVRPVSYTHLDVYKRQLQKKLELKLWRMERRPKVTRSTF